MFLYRFWYLRGIGGYQSAFGGFKIASVLQALVYRPWSFLFVPVNWSIRPSWWLALPLVIAVAVALTARVNKVHLAAAVCFTIFAALPAFALLLIGPSMSGARVLYLPSIGMALIWAVIAEGTRRAVVLAAALGFFQMLTLWHNQRIWGEVTKKAKSACLVAGEFLRTHPSAEVSAENLPKTKDGVFFLANGFPQCVAVNTGVEPSRVRTQGPAPYVFRWNDKDSKLEQNNPK